MENLNLNITHSNSFDDHIEECTWESMNVSVQDNDPYHRPKPLCGHSLTMVGSDAFVFGGLIGFSKFDMTAHHDENLESLPSNIIYKLGYRTENISWMRLNAAESQSMNNSTSTLPLPRWKHTATALDDRRILIIGGYHSTSHRLNDVWMYDVVSNTWSQPNIHHNLEASSKNQLAFHAWANAPSPRAGHSATLIGNHVYVFGGYGGIGYSRRDLDDLYALTVDTMQWQRIIAKGVPPEKRSGHQACAIGNKLYIIGGTSSSTQYQEMYVLDLSHEPTWSKLSTIFPQPIWNHTAAAAVTVPHHKIFSFGGIMGALSDQNRLGISTNMMSVLDCGSNTWSRIICRGNCPDARCDSSMIYDHEQSRLILFGGYSDYWLNDVYILPVDRVVGPPFAISSLNPTFGAVTGGTDIIVTGIDFIDTDNILVRFGDDEPGDHVDVAGIFISSTTLRCASPSVPQFTNTTVSVRLSFNHMPFTNTMQNYSFFSVTAAHNCVAYGAGMLSGCVVEEETNFIIQARDADGADRRAGGDEFIVSVISSNNADNNVDVKVSDTGDGWYWVSYTVHKPGRYKISIEFMGSYGGIAGTVRGSGSELVFVNASISSDSANNKMSGENMIRHVKNDINYLLQFTNDLSRVLFVKVKDDTWSAEDHIRVLMSVKEAIVRSENAADEMRLIFDRSDCALEYFRQHDVHVMGLENDIKSSKQVWDKIQYDAPSLLVHVTSMMRTYAAKIKSDVCNYEAHVKSYREEVKRSEFYSFNTGPGRAIDCLDAAESIHQQQMIVCEKMMNVTTVFEVVEDIIASREVIQEVSDILHNYRLLWETYVHVLVVIEEANSLPWINFDAETIEDSSKSLISSLRKLPKMVKPSDAFQGLEKLVKEFVSTCPIIMSLRSPAMRPRHWNELMQVVHRQFDVPSSNPMVKLVDLLKVGFHEHASDVEEITEKAVKEAKHEEILELLGGTWSTAMFSMTLYKDTSIPLVRLDDEVVEQLESDQMAVQSILGSRFGHFKSKAIEWQQYLAVISDVAQLLADIQRTWTFLEPLFIHSEEVKKELPVDSKQFQVVDERVRMILTRAWNVKIVKETCLQRGLLEALIDLQRTHDVCKKSLAEYLDNKRTKFPRFYFISEADLLDILSNSSQPDKVLRHIDKILLATKEIVTVKPTGSSMDLIRLQSTPYSAIRFLSAVGNEVVFFDTPIILTGKAEDYLMTLLQVQRQVLSRSLLSSVTRYSTLPRLKWLLLKHDTADERVVDPTQICLLVSHIVFSKQTEAALTKPSRSEKSNLHLLVDLIRTQLGDLIAMTTGSLSKDDRQRLMCLITMDAHNRDIIDVMIQENVAMISDFLWQSKMRAYYVTPSDSNPNHKLHAMAEFRICDAAFSYGFEYLGNASRLVVTPLTDRVYVTAAKALHLKMGCAPAGPAGTGKTETTKDLASSLGKCCYVFNSSPEIDYKTMGNIFKGLAASGTWGCFDEFNRLIPEVLSVCSVQFKSICDGLKGYHNSIESDVRSITVIIEGDAVTLDPTCGVFITMNPGYLGRSELPEGLKALFRPITVMIPDLVLICENMLMAEGFQTAKTLATKFYALYSLLAKLLSRQSHYDWGLRAVKSVLVVAGQFRRETPHLNEDDILLRALRDFNTPKIVEVDEVIFFGLLNDLFPNLNPQRIVDEELADCVTTACEDNGYVADSTFTLKVMQLEELLQIRHCVFIMGEAGSGKSSCWKALRAARNIRIPSKKVKVVDINPKVLPTEDLYGHINLMTREWKDGLLSRVMRDLSSIPNDHAKWIVLDGDLDANWIESMNSVMDDNRMLTLACNERIPLREHMRMLFEIRDLKYATPATVSRAGILFLSTDCGSQWRCIVTRWIRLKEVESLDEVICHPDAIDADARAGLNWQDLFEKYLPDCLKFFTTVSGVVYFNEISLVASLLRLLDVLLPSNITCNKAEDFLKIESIFVFCLLWGFGSFLTVSDDGVDQQRHFSDWFRAKFKTVKIPLRDSVFDYWLDEKGMKFEPWKMCPVFRNVEFNSMTMSMSNITIPTAQTTSLTFWMTSLVQKGHHVMLAGGAGTGKSQLINGMISNLNPEYHTSYTINMNYYTTANILQASLESCLQKRTGSTFGPAGSVNLIYFVDDMNLPEVDTYGTQSAIALLRQQVDYGHWYDRHKLVIKKIDNTQFLAAMNPTAGSFQVNPRLQRHFSTFAVTMPSVTSLHTIFLSFLTGHLTYQNFKPAICSIAGNMIKAALGIHREVSETFRKTAFNFHYEFHIRHISNIFQGLLASSPAIFKDAEKFVNLWLHESERVYCDRLVDPDDVAKFKQILMSHAKKTFPQFNASRFYQSGGGVQPDPLIFCHFVNDPAGRDSHDSDDLVYDQATNINSLRTVLTAVMKEYNESNPYMDLVLFDDAILHVTRIVRIISQPRGHALLVGVGGSGRQSLARLSSFICNYYFMQISSSDVYTLVDFKNDIQTMYNRAGVKQDGVLFLLTDNHINNERMLVYVNDLLSGTDIPDLFNRDEKDGIIGILTNKAKADGYSTDPASIWNYFLLQVRRNMRVCLSFSPMGNNLRKRARRFPAIISCTTIDWFRPWNDQALVSVGRKKLASLASESTEVARAIEHFIPQAFLALNKLSKAFLLDERRHVYNTPKSYLEMISLFQSMIHFKSVETDTEMKRLQNGIEKLVKAADDVVQLETDLQVMLTDAETKRVVAEKAAEVVQAERVMVELENEKVRIEEINVGTIQAEVSVKYADAAKDLQQAEPALMRAMAALDSLDRRDLGNCRTMSKPPSGVDDVFAAVMVLLAGVNPNIIVQKNGKVREKERTWEASKKALLGNINGFMDELKGFKALIDEGSVPDINWKEIRSFFSLLHFNPEDIEKKNSAAAGLCLWVINIVNYYDIVQMVEPKRVALRQANESLTQANEALLLVREQLKSLQEKMDALTLDFQKAENQRVDALSTAERGKLKLELARRLILALGSEKVRWSGGVNKIKEAKKYLVGNCLLAASCVSYLGPFTEKYRQQFLSNTLIPLLSKGNSSSTIMSSHASNPLRFVMSESDIAEFQTQGLPADANSSQNASIVVNSMRYPLLIDPQLQALNWIKRREGTSMMVGRMGQKDLIPRLLIAVESGQSFLVENVGDNIDGSLLPFICRQTIRRNHRHYLVVGNREVEMSPRFRLYLHTKLFNPHYPPEIYAETTVVNFSVTQSGLEEQLLAIVVKYERNDLATQRAALIMQQNLFMIRVKQLEESILLQLSDATGDITDNRPLIEELELSKKLSTEIAIKLEESRVTSEKLKVTSEKYRPVARRGALIYFAMNSLQKLHAYYMYSLKSFLQYFFLGISTSHQRKSPKSPAALLSARSQYSLSAITSSPLPVNTARLTASISYEQWIESETAVGEVSLDQLGFQIMNRVKEIEEKDRRSQDTDMTERILELQLNVTVKILDFLKVGLFDEDKVLVSTLIALRVMVDEGMVERGYVDALIRGRCAEDPPPRGEDMARWIPEQVWARLRGLEEDLMSWDSKFDNLTDKISLDADEWEEWYNASDIETRSLPGEYKEMSFIQQLLIIRAMRPDKLASLLISFMRFHLGEDFVAQHQFNLASILQHSTAKSPILFVLHPGTNPTEWIESLAREKHVSRDNHGSKQLHNISMGQGQENRASDLILQLSREGGWVFLQNVHLMQSWLPKLEESLESIQPHPDFRLFLSAEPPPLRSMKNIPEGLLISCITVSNEPPSDLRANLSRAWATIDEDRIEASPMKGAFKACLFGLCFFHSVMLGRRRFGSQGWTRAYSFNMGDLKICADVLESYLSEGRQSTSENIIPWRDLQYLFGEIMYGGHITDFFDRRVNMTYLSLIFQDRIVKKGELVPKLFSPDSREFNYDDYRAFIETSLPAETPSIYGLPINAEVGVLSNKAEVMFNNLLALEFGSGMTGNDTSAAASSTAKDVMHDLLKRIPDIFHVVDLIERSKEQVLSMDGPYVVMLIQECSRFNVILAEISSSLLELQKGLVGLLNMSQAMEELAECLLLNMVPGRNPLHSCSWEKSSWLSKKSLSSWFNDFLSRRKQLESWNASLKLPCSVCLPYLINPMALLTAIKQVTARKLKLPLDSMAIDTHVTRMIRASEAVTAGYSLDDGILVHGLLIEGARWSDEDEVVTSITTINEVMCGGQLCDSRPKQLLAPMPIMYLQAVQIKASWTPEAVGYLRNDASVYDCPVFTTTDRGASFVFLSTLTSVSAITKWILAGVALIMQSDD